MSWLLRSALIALLLSLGLLSAGCSHGKKSEGPAEGGEPGELVIWNAFEDTAMLLNIANLYGGQGGPPVTIEPRSPETIEQEFVEALANGQGPDIILLPSELVYKHRDKLASAPAELFDPAAVRGTFLPAAAERNIADSQVYGVTLGLEPLLLYTNTTALADVRQRYVTRVGRNEADRQYLTKPPDTWGELRDMSREAVVRRGAFIDFAGAAIGTGENTSRAADLIAQLVLSFGGTMVRADGTAAAFQVSDLQGRRPGLAALDFYSSYADPGHLNYSWNVGIGDPLDRFAENRLVFLFGFNDLGVELQRRNPKLGFTTSLPPKQSLLDPRPVVVRSTSFAVSRVTKDSRAAWQFLQFVTTDKPLREYFKSTGKASAFYPAPGNEQSLENVLLTSFFTGPSPELFEQTLLKLLSQAFQNRRQLSSLLEAAADDITQLLQTDGVSTPSEALP